MEGSVHVTFHDTSPLEADEKILSILEVCAERGLSIESDEFQPPTKDSISLEDSNQLELYLRDERLRLHFGTPEFWEGPAGRTLSIFADTSVVQSKSATSDSEPPVLRDRFLQVIKDLAIELDPVLVSTWNTIHRGEVYPLSKELIPLERPIETQLSRIPWLGIYSEPYIEEFGGRERVLETPAWKVEELENGHILIITTREPWAGYSDPLPADEYLLEGDDDATLADDSDDFDLSDPFATLDPGEYGTDVCVYRDDIAAEFRNEDIKLVRVYVDEAGDLRRISDDTFVRNVVRDCPDNKVAFVKRMLAGVPADANDDDLMVSALLRGPIPPEFVHASDPEAETVASKVLALDAETNKVDLLISLARAARQREDVDAAVQSIETALDELSALGDVDGLDRWIEENLL